ncbi:vWA domain-containing protein [Nocardioides cynanchi]|uniref:vWA domain-containing protein n=1 Tax=Nocardioides cynanchi TaxID=2558918 RepID=UPI0012493A2D|nr:VWA domain-containing protein [Nocardioides cynanchi]
MSRPQPRSRYTAYDGGPDPLAPPVDIAEALDAIGQDVMAGYSPERAMREFLRRGGRDQQGLDDLARRIAEKRRELTSQHNLDGTLQEVRELLDHAVLEERKQLARDITMDDGDRALRELQLDHLPQSTAAAVTELGDYDWKSREAREAFEQIKDLLGRELLDQRFAGMKQALENATDADRAAVNEMLTDLNDLLSKHASGRDTDQDFADFMDKHGDYFPENPQNVEELIDALAQRAAAAQRMMNSMTAEQRAELMALADQAFGSPELMQQLSQLDANLQSLRPGEDWGGSEGFDGQQGLGLGDGTGALQDLADLDSLAEQLSQSYDGARLDDVDLDLLAQQLGNDAAVDARTLQRLEQALRDSGYLKRSSDGQLKLSPKAMRQLGKALLKDVATRMSGRQGQRDLRQAGAAGELSGATREWQFGDTEPWDVTRTVTNAVRRVVGEGGPLGGRADSGFGGRADSGFGGRADSGFGGRADSGFGGRADSGFGGRADSGFGGRADSGFGGRAESRPRLRLRVEDVEVSETEARTQAAVALLVDTSFSMAMDGRWVPMKRTALALHTLIRSRFRGDALQLIGFGRHAQVMDIEELTGLDAMWDKGTNLHHALLLANRFFRKHPNAQPVLLIVTDGEPTSHLEPNGEVYFEYPPHPLTVAYSVRELDSSGRIGAQVTFFRLGTDPGLARFVDSMARRVDGRVVAPELDDLGAAVVGSYLGSRGPAGPGGDFGDWFGGGRGRWVG